MKKLEEFAALTLTLNNITMSLILLHIYHHISVDALKPINFMMCTVNYNFNQKLMVLIINCSESCSKLTDELLT